MTVLRFNPDAAHNADTYISNDRALWEQFELALVAVEMGRSRARQVAVRWGPNTAWVIPVSVQGRDDQYQVLWVRDPDSSDTALVVYLGRAL